MEKTIEIKAMNKENAIERALNILEATPNDIVNVLEKEKSKSSFLGLFKKEGIFSITINKNKILNKNKDSLKKESKSEKTIEISKEKLENTKDLTKEERIEIIQERTEHILNLMDLNFKIEINHIEGRRYSVDLYGEDKGIIIGKKGKTLNNFEYLLNLLVSSSRIDVDVEGFRKKRDITLRELGKKMAEKAINTGKTIRLNPMPAKERKIIHEIVNEYENLDTFSEGKDPKRYIVIKRKR